MTLIISFIKWSLYNSADQLSIHMLLFLDSFMKNLARRARIFWKKLTWRARFFREIFDTTGKILKWAINSAWRARLLSIKFGSTGKIFFDKFGTKGKVLWKRIWPAGMNFIYYYIYIIYSSHTIKTAFLSSLTVAEPRLILHSDSSIYVKSRRSLRVEWVVRPPGSNVAAIPDEATAIAIFYPFLILQAKVICDMFFLFLQEHLERTYCNFHF